MERDRFSPNSLIFAADLRPSLSAACQLADTSFVCPHATDLNFISHILKLVEEQDVGLIVPMTDQELLPLAQSLNMFKEKTVSIAVPDLQTVELCRDKRKTASLFECVKIKYPKIMDRSQLTFPVFVKPRNGSSSIGARLINDHEQLDSVTLEDPDNMFMQYIAPPYAEYSVDAYYDQHSRLITLVPRRRLETRAGEISIGLTDKVTVRI